MAGRICRPREYEAAQERTNSTTQYGQRATSAPQRNSRNFPTKPESSISEPSQHRLIAVDATFESLHQLLAENPAGVFVLRDELTGWLASLERQGRESSARFTWSAGTEIPASPLTGSGAGPFTLSIAVFRSSEASNRPGFAPILPMRSGTDQAMTD